MRTFVSKGTALSHRSYSTVAYFYAFQFQISTQLIVLEVYGFVSLLRLAVTNHIVLIEIGAEKELGREMSEPVA